jgi:predicted ATPase/DNA-binding CsgD family transcriptional regulator
LVSVDGMAVSDRSLALSTEPVTPAGLVARRRALGLTQRALAEMLGVPRNTVARWERGDLRMARPDWLALALGNFEARAHGPPVATLDVGLSSPSQAPHLPAELSSFVGRERELAECCALLGRERLVTLTGTGGIGKSRLAMTVAACVAPTFPQGVYLVELAALEEPALVPRAVATALGLADSAQESVTDVLIEALRPRKLLLVMDDCDHLVEACGDLAKRLLRGAPQAAILATCREPLDVRGEIAWRVPALKLPSADASLDEIARSEAVRLFVERARLVAPWFKLTEASAPAVARVCRRLDGIPLALELAAARMKALSLDQVVARLERSFQLLTCGSRTAPDRQQTLRATVDWSYSLLNESERALFRRLSVFAGGWTLDAAERVTQGNPITPEDTLCLMERLIDKSLVISEERSNILRQAMLETLREYAHERLIEAGEEETVRRRHLRWILETVESIDPDQLSPGMISVLALEIHNLRGALAWSMDASETELGLRLASAAGMVWNYRGHFAEGIRWLKRALDLPGAADLPRLRARALKWSGILSYGLGDIRAARAWITEGYELIAGHADERDAPLCAQLLGSINRASGDLAGALERYQQALAEYRRLGLQFWEATTWFMTASVLFELGDYAASRTACDRCLALGQSCRFPFATSRARVILAYLARHDGNNVGAERLAQEALAQQRALDEPSGTGISLRALSQFALEDGRVGRAWSYLAEALEIARVEGDRMALARTLETLACVLACRAPGQAARIAGAASVLRTHTGTAPWPSEQARLGRWLGIARGKIGTRAFEVEWKVGEAFSDGEAILAANRFAAESLGSPVANAAPVLPESPLTARQREVVALVARGLTNVQIAHKLVISPATARAHVEHVLDRLDLHSRAQVAAWAAAQCLVAPVNASEEAKRAADGR